MAVSSRTTNRPNDADGWQWKRGISQGGTFRMLLGLAAMAGAWQPSVADEETASSSVEARSRGRLDVMRGAIEELKVASSEIKAASDLKFADRPLLRYSDQSRETGDGVMGVLDATVWRLGLSGRPKAIVTLEIYPVAGRDPLLAYEFISLSPQKFEMSSARVPKWSPHGTELEMAALEDAPPPADAPRGRLAQMRVLAARFTATEEFQGQKIVCRMLPQPIDRYDNAPAGIVDGAIFAFANGTNPEMGLVLECSEKQWSYGAFRLSAAALVGEFDGKKILQLAKLSGDPVNGSYTGTREWIKLPE